ncbi:tRNA N(3)-methylcytidine methyltransferase METTL6-like [Actinia tenebrosa]|uniref:tRNA N(3)-methylcytidine methyltransferase n=1 Tax=Actinia tenebrosa TaxID=6105 RepID=A0A6P8IN20_ACTTE|nr:tRNA N(3)-methylcytidine methyltransferase METTL6-like [Actinia tenebrosa]
MADEKEQNKCREENATNSSRCPRILTENERIKLTKDINLISEFKRNKLEKEAQKNWDLFYKRNSTNFFKDRHWTTREFKELLCSESEQQDNKVLLEAGCGVGNFFYPLIEEGHNFYVHACDFSPRAVQFVKEHSLFDCSKVNAFQCDLTQDQLTNNIPECSVDLATLIFVLSAVHPDKMLLVLQNIWKVLMPGGILLFRDYGLYDHAMLRFAPGHKLSDNFYVRQDGTRAFYFTTESIENLVQEAGFNILVNEYIEKRTVNKKEQIDVPRIFVQGKFSKLS